MSTLKKVDFIQRSRGRHWVGDGFPVQSIFSYNDRAAELSPFLLFDYAGPADFTPTTARRGVGAHPHKGFETVTIVYSGEVQHRDSSGGGGVIKPGDVQWMTAASGIVHDEFHSDAFAKAGGRFEMIQLWVNLPAKDKKAKPGYQNLLGSQIPKLELPDGAGTVRVIAGEHAGARGPARTFTPIDLWDLEVKAGKRVTLKVPHGHLTSLFVLQGALASGDQAVKEAELAVFHREGDEISFETKADSRLLLMGGEPIREPVAGYGPFVMNTGEELREAFAEFESGRMGRLS